MRACLMGFAGAFALIALTSVHLDYQGVYYDELHQGPASFRYLGKNPQMFTIVFNDILLLNTSYGGAIKSHVYGLYLRFIRPHFTVYSWRLLGILFVAAGLFAFYWIAGLYIHWTTGLIFAMLLLTDATVLLSTRYDWGPTALGLSLRLILLGTWLSMEFGRPSIRKHFFAGLIVGIAIFEKLVAVVLLGPLFLMLLSGRKLGRRVVLAAMGGGLLGVMPILYANYGSYRHGGGFISLALVEPRHLTHLSRVTAYVYQYLALGHGEGMGAHLLGPYSMPFWPRGEVVLMFIVLAIISVLAIQRRRSDKSMAVAGKMVAAYALAGGLLLLVPRDTVEHHWIQITPFQYAAIALAFGALSRRSPARLALITIVGALLLIRTPNVIAVERALAEGKATIGFDPVFTRLAKIAAAKSKDAAFIAQDWGIGTQIYCMGDGDDDLVYEPFWSNDVQRVTLSMMQATKKNTLYFVSSSVDPRFADAARSAILATTQATDWEEAPVEKELTDLNYFQIRKFVRRS
jgi:hypothetical protein